MINQILAAILMSGLSRLHGMDNNIPKVVESVVFATGAGLIFTVLNPEIEPSNYIFIAIIITALGKSMGYTKGISIGNGKYSIINSLWVLWRKGLVIALPWAILSLYAGQNTQAFLMVLASFQLVIAYSIGYYVQKYTKIKDSKTLTGEFLGGAIFGTLL